jgi:aryl-alcohol dehydrogenase-like predicted oxidoreductase
VVAPIASATSARQLEELAGFARIRLAPDTVAKLDAASVGGDPPPAW